MSLALSGLVSFIPGGFGAFDLVVLLGLKSLGISEEKILLALVLYRFAYYFVPVMIALILSSFEFGNTAKNISTIRSTLYPKRLHFIFEVLSERYFS